MTYRQQRESAERASNFPAAARKSASPPSSARPAAPAVAQMAAKIGGRLASERVAEPARPNHTGLPDRLKHNVEALSGISLDDVTVHRNSLKPAHFGANAYAQGKEIHLAPGQEKHLPHEAWHVVQQKQGRVRATARLNEGTALNDDRALEREADMMGARALSTMSDGDSPAMCAVSPADAPMQCSRITDELDESNAAWGEVQDRIGGISDNYGTYEGRILSLDNSPREPAGFAAAKGVRHWADNYRNKTIAYLTELETAIIRTNGPRLAALGTSFTTEPDMFTLRDDGASQESPALFGSKDHTEMKRTEGQEKDIKSMVREATHQLVARKDDKTRRYIVETHAPNWFPNLQTWSSMRTWANKWATKNAARLKSDGQFSFRVLLVRIYYAQASVPITVSVDIPHQS